jgi:RHS repeat-associated protein
VTNPRGHSNIYRFNSAGYLVSETNALGQTTSLEREAETNLVLSTTDPMGRITRFAYDSKGNMTSITDALQNIRRFEYEPIFSRLSKITDAVGNVTTFTYDNKGNLTSAVDATGASTTIGYNTFGQLSSTTDTLGNTTAYGYDANGNLARVVDPLGNEVQKTYDSASRMVEQTDARGRSTQFVYDGLNRITQVADALGGVTSFSYDGNSNLLTVTDARGNTTTHSYDVMDRLASRTDQVGAVEFYQYDGMGNLISHTDRKGQTNSFSYDALNRRTGGNYADGATTRFVYDGGGRLVEASDSIVGGIFNSYDALNRLLSQTTSLGIVSYRYDGMGRRTRMDVSGQSAVTYAYDAVNRLKQIVQGSQVVDFTYDALGRRTRLTLPNGVSTEYQYDAASRVAALIYRNATGVLGDLTYEYDGAGNRTAVGGSFARTLLPDSVTSATYDAANRQLQFGDKAMEFDANGNLVSSSDFSGTTAFSWDTRNRLSGLAGRGTNASFAYDVFGRRTAKTVNGEVLEFQYDNEDIVLELNGSPASVTRYAHGPGIDEPLFMERNGERFLYHADVLGTVIELRDTAGNVSHGYTYSPFGNILSDVEPILFQPYAFSGREFDVETGLYFYRARYYDAVLGRFLQEDPIGFAGRDINFYAYGANNPVKNVDPSGTILPLTVIVPIIAGLVNGTIAVSVSWQRCDATADELLQSFGNGAVAGIVGSLAGLTTAAITGNPALAGATAGLSSNIVEQFLNGAELDAISAGGATLGGSIGNVLAPSLLPQVGRRPYLNTFRSNYGPNSYRLMGQEAISEVVEASVGAAAAAAANRISQ